ncbi:MAG: hypothetical protein Q7R43_00635, partial [Candidatus Daviesbacteria bacterium]|nr:hypothetical protein [Candidatus Daviesbacteria bacterium]
MNEIQLLHEALNLIYVYNHGGEKIQEDIKKKGYNKRAVSYYFPVLVRYSPAFSSYYQKTFNKPAASIQSQIKTYVKKMLKQKTSEDDLDVIDIFLYKCYKDQTNYNKLWQTTQPRGMFSANELTQLERYGQEPNGPGAALILASLLRNNQEEGVKEPTINDLVAKITDTTKISEEDKKKAAELLKNKIKLYEKYIKDPKLHEQLIKKGFLTQAELDSIVKSGLVSVKGIEPEFNKTGLKTAEEREKATLEAAERLLKSEIEKREALEKKTPPPTPPTPPSPPSPIILPRPNIRPLFSGLNIQIHNLSNKVITSGLPIMSNAVRGAGNQAANGASSLLKGGSNIFRNLDQFKGSRVATRGIVVSLFIALFIVIAIMSFTGIGGEAAPLPPGYGGEDISSCKFTRSDQNPKETAFQSPRLLSYIQEASRLSGIPAA